MPPQNPRPYKYLAIIGVLVIYALVASILAFRSNLGSKSQIAVVDPNELFSDQSATIKGKVDSINGNMLMVTNNKGVKGELEMDESVVVNDLTQPGSTASNDPKDIKTGRDAVIYLQLEDGKYKVGNITYQTLVVIPPLPDDPTAPVTPGQFPSSAPFNPNDIEMPVFPSPPVLPSIEPLSSLAPVPSYLPMPSP